MCECVNGYVCPQHIAQTVARRPRGITIREATNTLRGTSISAYNRKPFFTAFRTLQGYLAKKQGRRRCVTRIQVYEWANGHGVPQNIYNTPSEPQNVKLCLAEINGRGVRELSCESRDFLRDYVRMTSSMVSPISMIEFVRRGGSRHAYERLPFYWAKSIESKMMANH